MTRKRLTSVMHRAWFVESTLVESDSEWGHIFLPASYGVNGLRPGKKVTCDYGQDTPRRALWNALTDERVPAMTEVVPACGEENCIQPRHAVKISRSTAQLGRTRGSTVAEVLAWVDRGERTEHEIPAWANTSDPKQWSDFKVGLGQTAAIIIWKIAKAELLEQKKIKGQLMYDRVKRDEYINPGTFLIIDVEKMLDGSASDVAGVVKAMRGYEPHWLRILGDAFRTIPTCSWIKAKLETSGADELLLPRHIANKYGQAAMSLTTEYGEDVEAVCEFSLVKLGTEEDYREGVADIPEPD